MGHPNSTKIKGNLFPGNRLTSGWLQVRQVSAVGNDIPVEPDTGEREAIALVLEIQTQQILLDEQEARQVAQKLGLRVMGTLGILLLAKRKQTIPEVYPLLDAKINTAQY